MTPEPEGGSLLAQLVTWAAGGIAVVGAWLWSNTMGRLQKVEELKLDRTEFDKAMTRIDKNRDERRETELKLFDKLDDLKDMIQEMRK